MLAELNALEAAVGEERIKDVIKAVHYLLRHQFVYAGDHGTTGIFSTVTDSRFATFIENYFDAAGYRLHSNDTEQWVGILPNADEIPLPRMRLDDTITLLVLALHWQEEINAGKVEERATVVTTVNAVHDKYNEIASLRRKVAIPISTFVAILEEFQRRNIVEVRNFDFEQQNRELVIRPQIRLLAGDDILSRLERFIADKEAADKRHRGEPATPEPDGSSL